MIGENRVARPRLRPLRTPPPGSRSEMRWLAFVAASAALAWSFVSIAILIVHVARHGGVLSGSDGPLAGSDQFLYMDDIRQSGTHVLIVEHFDLTIGHAVYLHPLYLLAGLLWRAGVSIAVAFWSLKLLAAPILAIGISAVVVRCLHRGGERVAAAALGLFYMSPLVPLLAWGGAITGFERFKLDLPAAETMPAWQLWGYPHAAIAIGLLALALVGAVSVAGGSRSRKLIVGICICSGLAAWMHPWQGAIFILVIAALAVRGRSRRLSAALAIPVAVVLLPLVYEAILPHLDPAWRTLSRQNGAPFVPIWMLLVALVPLLAPALLGVRAFPDGPLRTVLVAWPLAALAVFAISPQFRYHALQGMSIPLAVLSVAGWRSVTSIAADRFRPAVRWVGVTAVALAVIAGPAYEASTLRDSLRANIAPYWFTPDDRQALSFLDHVRTRGGVLSRYYLGMAVPAYTGRRTWMGETTWTPGFASRRAEAERAFSPSSGPAEALTFVHAVGARFVLTDCGISASVNRVLDGLPASVHHFGCATVFVLRGERAKARSSR